MRGEQEKICFEQIKKQAIKKCDMRLLCFLDGAVANSDSNAFPDFVFEDGFIEHFQVTAAIETRKGSAHNIAENVFTRDSIEALDRERKEFLELPPRENAKAGTYDLAVIPHEMVSPEYSYDSFVKSFKRNFEKHLQHLQGYNGDKTNGIFLIELVGAHITILKNGQFVDFYRLAKDYNLLTYVYGFSDQVRYVVFADSDRYELIETKDIPTRLQYIPKDTTFGVGRYSSTNLHLFIDV